MKHKIKDIINVCCDKCDNIDGDYLEDLKWNTKTKRFVCRRGHKENWNTATRHIDFGVFEDYFRFLAGFKR